MSNVRDFARVVRSVLGITMLSFSVGCNSNGSPSTVNDSAVVDSPSASPCNGAPGLQITIELPNDAMAGAPVGLSVAYSNQSVQRLESYVPTGFLNGTMVVIAPYESAASNGPATVIFDAEQHWEGGAGFIVNTQTCSMVTVDVMHDVTDAGVMD